MKYAWLDLVSIDKSSKRLHWKQIFTLQADWRLRKSSATVDLQPIQRMCKMFGRFYSKFWLYVCETCFPNPKKQMAYRYEKSWYTITTYE